MSTLQELVSKKLTTIELDDINDVVYNIIASNIGIPYIEDANKYTTISGNNDILHYFVDLMDNNPDSLLYTSLMNNDLRVSEYILLNKELNNRYTYAIVYNLIYIDNAYLLNLYGSKYEIEYHPKIAHLWIEEGGNMDMIDILISGGMLKKNYTCLYECGIVKYGTIELVLKYEQKREWKSNVKSLLQLSTNSDVIQHFSSKL